MANPDLHGDRREEPALAPDQVRPHAIPDLTSATPRMPCGAVGQRAAGRPGIPPDPGCYEEHHGLAWPVALILAVSLLIIGLGIFVPAPPVDRVIIVTLGGLFALPYVPLLPARPLPARQRLAFASRRRDALVFRGSHADAFPHEGCGARIASPKDSS
jgi:hypothetical protein